MVAMRQIARAHLTEVYERVMLLKPSATRTAILRLHAVLMAPENYSLLFGRVHKDQRTLLDGILKDLVGVRKKTLLAHWRLYGAFVVSMYSTRQAILSAKGVESKLAHIQSDFVLRRRDMRGLETVSGIELTTQNFFRKN